MLLGHQMARLSFETFLQLTRKFCHASSTKPTQSNVCHYREGDGQQDVLKHVSFDIEPQQTAGFVGRTGR